MKLLHVICLLHYIVFWVGMGLPKSSHMVVLVLKISF